MRNNCIILYVRGIPETFISYIKLFNEMEWRYKIFMASVGVNHFQIHLKLKSQNVKKFVRFLKFIIFHTYSIGYYAYIQH
jgi:hypothetical protein